MAEKWAVLAEPVGANPEVKPGGLRKRITGTKEEKEKDNVGGVVVYVTAAGRKMEEVARVGFVRKTSENPDVTFDAKLDEIVKVAKKTVDTLNKLTPDGDLQ